VAGFINIDIKITGLIDIRERIQGLPGKTDKAYHDFFKNTVPEILDKQFKKAFITKKYGNQKWAGYSEAYSKKMKKQVGSTDGMMMRTGTLYDAIVGKAKDFVKIDGHTVTISLDEVTASAPYYIYHHIGYHSRSGKEIKPRRIIGMSAATVSMLKGALRKYIREHIQKGKVSITAEQIMSQTNVPVYDPVGGKGGMVVTL